LYANSEDDLLGIFSSDTWPTPIYHVKDWVVGAKVYSWNTAFDSEGNVSSLRSELTLTAISAVPEPTTILLFGTGLVCLAGFRMKSRKK